VVEFYGRHERISEKQDGSLVGGTPGFVVSTVNCLFTIYVLSWLFLSQAIFPFHSFCFHNFSPPFRKILAAPLSVWHGDAGDAVASPNMKNWPLFGQKCLTFGQSIQLHSRVSEVVSIFPTKAKQCPKQQNNLRLFCHFFSPLMAN